MSYFICVCVCVCLSCSTEVFAKAAARQHLSNTRLDKDHRNNMKQSEVNKLNLWLLGASIKRTLSQPYFLVFLRCCGWQRPITILFFLSLTPFSVFSVNVTHPFFHTHTVSSVSKVILQTLYPLLSCYFWCSLVLSESLFKAPCLTLFVWYLLILEMK